LTSLASLGPPIGAGATEGERLEGAWRAVAAERNGAPAPDLIGHVLTFQGERFRITGNGGLLFGGTFTAEPAAQPARITFQQTEGPTLRGTWRGIYRFVEGRLEIVDNAPDMNAPPPSTFSAGPGYVMLRFVRP
jgi:uncharacterized protein (TIGR03067 family)